MNDAIKSINVIKAVRKQPGILKQIVADPKNHLDTHGSYFIEREAFKHINTEALGKQRFAQATRITLNNYYKVLGAVEHTAMRYERQILKDRVLQGWHIYEEIAVRMTIRFKSVFTWRYVKELLAEASREIARFESFKLRV